MLIFWTRLLEAWLLPPASLVLINLLGLVLLWLGRRRLGLLLLVLSTLVLYLLSTPWAASQLLATLDWYPPLNPKSLWKEEIASNADMPSSIDRAIVVLGAGFRRGAREYENAVTEGTARTVSLTALERLRYTAWLHRQAPLPVLVTGASAAEMGQALEDEFAITVRWRETESVDTAQNAYKSAQILCSHGIRQVVLVSDFWHLPRAVRSFRWQGLDVVPAPLGFFASGAASPWPDLFPRPGSMGLASLALHEWLVWFAYRQPTSQACSASGLATPAA
jgi:uncharacterized SAM-binding protein YcdF (DUF218 family)